MNLEHEVFVVEKEAEGKIELVNFQSVLHPEKDIAVKRLAMPKLKDEERIGIDGLHVDLTPGALVSVSIQELNKGYAVHLANVGPEGEIATLQTEYVLAKLGIKEAQNLQHCADFLTGEGQFRKLLMGGRKHDS